ncbi:glycoside hydrolase family 15 protein [Methylorubrum extorquens]|uniref:glycoside hydrolase family 15 protein n=1 Tax=Methylorubrum extorquens TaxID=408 RepID=UPI000158EE15|nr:glycoside hydrolase family 15 protein [Methylorubrum extorquens]ABY32692.1 glycoside hydrolase 15-related [Methylorubrum extorquens PA1]KQP95608.1 glycoside hydrolase [Methylobacterium sp. Leaf119]WIU39290.1 glycoside hydrolase family 15 protein [Methylorubrum extorquens]
MTDKAIADYAVIGDTCTTALIARDGSLDWLCWPRHDGPAVFLALLDSERGGACRLVLDGLTEITRRYLPDTNILETTFVTATGRAVLTDFMPLHRHESVPEEGPDGQAQAQVVRRLACRSGRVSGRWRLSPSFDYARAPTEATTEGETGIRFRGGGDTIGAVCAVPLALRDGEAEGAFALGAGERADLVIVHGEKHGVDAEGLPGAVDASLADTRAYWEEWSGRCTYEGPYRETVLRSALTLKLLTHGPSGGIVAAATAGLPEAVPGNRNYDYRYVWMRDASFTVTAFVNLGYQREAAEFLRFLREADTSRGRDLHLMYALDGAVPEEEFLDHLRGWRGIGPVGIGNAAADQEQYDIYGEFLVALHGYLEAVEYDPPVKVNDHLPEALGHLTDHILRARHAADHGLWEMRTEKRQSVHTKAMLWVGLDRAVQIARADPKHRLASPDTIAGWERAADEIRAEYHARGWNAARGAYTMAYESDDLDAAVLRTVLFGAFDPHHPRIAKTLERVGDELGAGDLIYRYRMDDGLEGDEATFTACSFWRVGCLALAGRNDEATALFERLLARGNDLGLFAEEIDAETGEQRGNVPQGFTHMAVINHAVRLAAADRETPTDEPDCRAEADAVPA